MITSDITETIGKHDDFWMKKSVEAHSRIEKMFRDNKISIKHVLSDSDKIRHYEDAKKVLSFILSHASSCDEEACGIMSICELNQAYNALKEYK